MLNRRRLLTSAAAFAGLTAFAGFRPARADVNITLTSHYQVTRFIDADTLEMIDGNARQVMKRGDIFNGGALVEIVDGDFAVMEDFRSQTGDLLAVDTTGIRYRFGKTAEASSAAGLPAHAGAGLHAGAADDLAAAILARAGEPDYDTVAAIFAPIRQVAGEGANFIGTPDAGPTVWFNGDGETPDVDPATLVPAIAGIRQAGQTLCGMLGGYLPCARYVYPESADAWTELLAFAPMPAAAGPARPPVRYRIARVDGGKLVWTKYIDENQPPPGEGASKAFYADLAALKAGWDQRLAPAMKLDLAEPRVADMARHGLVRAMIAAGPDGAPGQADTLSAWGLGGSPAGARVAPALSRTCLGLPLNAAGQIDGGLVASHARALIAGDRAEEAVLLLYGVMAHLAVRGGGMAVAARDPFADEAAPYGAMSQRALALLVRWLLVFEDDDALWLGRAMPQAWLADARLNFIDDAATRWGRVSFATDSRIDKEHRIAAKVVLPDGGIEVPTRLRLRTGRPMRHVTVGDRSWKDFDAASGTITLPAGMGGTILIEARY